jgi:hypothetical protein
MHHVWTYLDDITLSYELDGAALLLAIPGSAGDQQNLAPGM